MTGIDRFNVRAYGLLVRDGQVLLSDEQMRGHRFSKFPGGGLEYGEGLLDCLHREFREEAGISIKVERLFYVNDFFQLSAFRKNEQIIACYYLVKPVDEAACDLLETRCKAGYQEVAPDHTLQLRWIDIAVLMEHVHFPIDMMVAQLLLEDLRNRADSIKRP